MFVLNNNKVMRVSCQFLIVAAFVLVSLYLVPYHEHWADEVQAWLIAKEASFYDIITKIGHSEGHPVLWHVLIKSCFCIFGEDINMSYISVGVMSLCVAIIVFGYDIPLKYKFLLPFGYYFLYQYNIIARNYCLGYLALAVLGLCYAARFLHPLRYALSLIFLANSVNFYMPVALFLGLRFIYEAIYTKQIKKIIPAVCILVLGGLFLIWQIFPVTAEYDISIHYFPHPILIAKRFVTTFTGWDNLIYMLLFAIVVGIYCAQERFYTALCKNLRTLLFILLCLMPFVFIKCRFYHSGLIYGLFLCLAYIFFPQCLKSGKHYVFVVILIMQIYQAVISISYDKMFDYSPQNPVMSALKRHHKEHRLLQILGYHALPVFSVLEKDNPVWKNDIPHYYEWKIVDFQRFIDRHSDILVVSDAYVGQNEYDFSYYENPDNFYIYRFNTLPLLNENLPQPLNLYIRKN